MTQAFHYFITYHYTDGTQLDLYRSESRMVVLAHHQKRIIGPTPYTLGWGPRLERAAGITAPFAYSEVH